MGTLEKVMQMKNQGQTEPQIINSLKNQGISAREINEALSQSNVKNALTPESQSYNQIPPSTPPMTSEISSQTNPNIQMHPSMTQSFQPKQFQENEQLQTQQSYQDQMQTIPSSFQNSTMPIVPMAQETSNFETPSQQYDYQEQPQYDSQGYAYPEYQPQDIGTMTEVAEQIIEEKTSNLKKQISSFKRFKEETLLDIEKLNERLLKIENTLNQLQSAILGKIGEYGTDIKDIAKEMHATQESFSKIINPLTDNIRELQKITRTEIKPIKPQTIKKANNPSKNQFENYLR